MSPARVKADEALLIHSETGTDSAPEERIFMQTKLPMTLSAILMGIAGVLFLFLPDESLSLFGVYATSVTQVFAQFLGTLYIAFAAVNWIARGNLIGGLHGRSITVGNFTHFFLGTLLFLRELRVTPFPIWQLAAMCVYVLFAVFFGRVLFSQPIKLRQSE